MPQVKFFGAGWRYWVAGIGVAFLAAAWWYWLAMRWIDGHGGWAKGD
jgi:putative solute:sodium symporter small subunit